MSRQEQLGFRHGVVVMAAALVAAITAGSPSAQGHETDQFSVPVGQEMADMGPFISALVAERIHEAANRLNARIRQAVQGNDAALRTPSSGHGPHRRSGPSRRIDPRAVLAVCHSPDGVAEAMWVSFGSAVDLIEHIETQLDSDRLQARYPGKLTGYNAPAQGESIYDGLYFPADPRTFFRLWHASSVNLYGHYLGTDKIGHFTDMGYHYYRAFRAARADGRRLEVAMAQAIEEGTDGLFSEKGALGYVTAGAYSNADLAANYVGALFYRNLTEAVVLKGKLRPPLFERDGAYWRVAPFVDEPDFFERFVSDHFDEALNPSLFRPIIRPTLRKKVRQRCEDLMQWYADRYGDRDPQAYFRELVLVLSTYYGQEYGHSRHYDDLIGLWNTCEADHDEAGE